MIKLLFFLLLSTVCCAQPDQNVKVSQTINGHNLTSDISLTASDVGAVASASFKGLIQLASKTGVSGAALATTNLTLASGVTLATHIPCVAIIKYASGTLGIAVAEIDCNTLPVTASLPLLTSTSSSWMYMPVIAGAIANTGNISVKITTASLAASTFDVIVYGIKY